jgi:hypothetical protein
VVWCFFVVFGVVVVVVVVVVVGVVAEIMEMDVRYSLSPFTSQ